MSSRSVTVLLAVLLLATNAFWLYRALDVGVTQAYQGQARAELDQASTTLRALAEPALVGLGADEALARLNALSDDAFRKDDPTGPSLLVGGGVVLVLGEDGRVAEVRTDAP